MNQKTGGASARENIKQKTLSFENIPHQSKLFTDFQTNSPNVKQFYPENTTALQNFAEQVLEKYAIDRTALCEILIEMNKEIGAGEKAFENIKLLGESDCLAIVTGQQAGLFSGAIYTIYKALSAVSLAENLRKQNIKAVPVFWIAEEDHDFEEVKRTYFLDKTGKLAGVENTPRTYVDNQPVGYVKFDESIEQTIEKLFDNMPHTEFTSEVRMIVKEKYRSGTTYSQSFAELIAKLFKDYGLIVISPLDSGLKKLCAPIFAEAVEKSDEIAAALLKRNTELKTAGYESQVLVAENFFPFFFQKEDGARQPMKTSGNFKIKIQNSKIEYAKSDLAKIAANSPQNLSPNALMRPVVQDFLLPTLVYFGGAAEIAYFAQNSVIYQKLIRPVTPIRHRASFTIIESKFKRTMDKYKLKLEDLFNGAEKTRSEIVEKYLNPETAKIFDETSKLISKQMSNLEKSLIATDSTLAPYASNRQRKILWHVDALRKKYHQAELLKDEIAKRKLEQLFESLLPNNALQERTINIVTFLNLYGTNFIRWVYETIEAEEKQHQILFL